MIERLGAAFAAIAERWMPSPFVLALLLTVTTGLLGVVVMGASPARALEGWGDGFWGFLAFGMQMTLVLVTGYALAVSEGASRGIRLLAGIPGGTRSAVALTAVVSLLVSLVHWGLGLIVGALLAREIGRTAARRGLDVHYPLVVAAAYAGFLSWHGGLSGSAPLTVATEGHFLESRIGVIGVEATLGSPLNLVMSGLLLLGVPLFLMAMAPRRGTPAPDRVVRDTEDDGERDDTGSPPWLDRSPWLGRLVALMGLWVVVRSFAGGGFSALDFNRVNFTFLFLGLLLYGSPWAYARAIREGIQGAAGIVLQFPFYAGILGMMKSTGLLERMSEIGASTGKGAFLVSTFLAAGAVNFFVPSGGGQWGVQGPVVVDAALELGVPVERAIMALAYGDEWTNMLQPFWALALLGVTGLAARDIVGYTGLVMLLTGPLYIGALLLLGRA
ncbi:MAG: short-chain fatty acids transporter [Gemmatimonadota bacterium]|nr:MAG: short-chain fatty acids transporter [Gemmatimonadota bacterium]